MCESCKQWSDEYNELSKEFQLYREEQEARILKLEEVIQDLQESNDYLRQVSSVY